MLRKGVRIILNIHIKNANEHNLKNVCVSIPIGKVTGITGVSGSGKSTLLRDVIAAYGARRFSNTTTKTIRDSLNISDYIKVEDVQNLPQTMYIDVKNHVRNPMSTVSTISGIHEILRNLFVEYADLTCPFCNTNIENGYPEDTIFEANLEINELFPFAYEYIQKNGTICEELYFDKNFKPVHNKKQSIFSTIRFVFHHSNRNLVKIFNKQFRCRLNIFLAKTKQSYDALREISCSRCGSILPVISRSRMSFNTPYSEGGGACKKCLGSGAIQEINYKYLIIDANKGILDGAISFVSDKGIKYTTITEKFLLAVLAKMGKDKKTTLKELSDEEIQYLFFGSSEIIKFTDRIGGKKAISFDGIVNYLKQSYKLGKGSKALLPFINECECDECHGSRMDPLIDTITYHGKTLSDLLKMTIEQLYTFFNDVDAVENKEKTYINRLCRKLRNYIKVSCGHLTLCRNSNTLSGGEVQRLRLCSLLNSKVSCVCYLLDEPSTGLHYQDIENLGELLREICANNNSILMVEHNAKLLGYCDYIVDMGPKGGKDGGNVLFQDDFDSLEKYDTVTSKLLTGELQEDYVFPIIESDQYIEFSHICDNNLKNVSVRIPVNCFTTICGISGSGKSTFVKYIAKKITYDLKAYNFKSVDYIGQGRVSYAAGSTIGNILKLNDYVAKIFEKISGITKESFLPNKTEGKCIVCNGTGQICSETKEFLGVCEACHGKGYSSNILSVKWADTDIYEIFNMSFEELHVKVNDKKLKQIAEFAILLGIGYLSLAREAKTLSKGELQRVALINVLSDKRTGHLIILDEPSKGMHIADALRLLKAIRLVIENGNTVVAVEHNPSLIKHSDYMVEFGGTGISGGYLLFQGNPTDIQDTPTAKMIQKHGVFDKNEKCLKERSNNLQDIVIETQERTLRFAPNSVYYVNEEAKTILNVARYTNEDFLSVAIPNNIFFSKSKNDFVSGHVPFMKIIDFAEKPTINISIGKVLGIERILSEIASRSGDPLSRYVFDGLSPTGKCKCCGGKGLVHSVPKEFFVTSNTLSVACLKFLKNSTDFVDFKKYLKKEKGISLDKNLDDMCIEEDHTLWWGYEENINVKGKSIKWEGIIPTFIKQYKYYPDESSSIIFKKKSLQMCPKCNGACLEKIFIQMKVLGLTYKQWHFLTIQEILQCIETEDTNFISNKKIINILKTMVECNLGKVNISNTFQQLTPIDIGKIKIIAEVFDGIYDSGIVICNSGELPEKEQEWLKEKLFKLAHNSTVWVVERGADH